MSTRLHGQEVQRASALAADLRALIGKLKRRASEQVDVGDLTPSQVSALIRLERDGPMTVTALARAEGVRPQSMGATIAVLQSAGHVSGAPDPNDRRQTMLSVMPACREWIGAARMAQQDWLVRAIQRELMPTEQDELARGIELLKRVAGS